MPVLRIGNGHIAKLYGLGKIRPFAGLSRKRVTKLVREHLRNFFGMSAIEVSCIATYSGHAWKGNCRINGLDYPYDITAD